METAVEGMFEPAASVIRHILMAEEVNALPAKTKENSAYLREAFASRA
jgi:hypothetical protein